MAAKPLIAITVGDYNGIGPEVTLKALQDEELRRSFRPLLIGPPPIFEEVKRAVGTTVPLVRVKSLSDLPAEGIAVLEPPDGSQSFREPGKLSSTAGRVAAQAIEVAVKLALENKVGAMVTAPVTKQALVLAGYDFPGQTEMLARSTNTRQFAMMLVGGGLRVALVTTHCALSRVPSLLSRAAIVEKLLVVHGSLQNDFEIKQPKIGVCSLNPHAGEGGLFGREESDVIRPAIEEARGHGIAAEGPFAADTLFAKWKSTPFDAYLAMYHDQGLIPLKMRSFGHGVNFTAGLPILRTSPDHGTAFDIAGKYLADAGSMKEAIRLAVRLAQKREARRG